MILVSGCEELRKDTSSLLIPSFQRSEIFGFIAGLGTTFAVLPDLLAMLRRRSSAGMNPRMAAI
jgi:MtN3 and saliva related transmembrane protein